MARQLYTKASLQPIHIHTGEEIDPVLEESEF